MKGQARPGIQESQEFAHHVEGIARGAPPVPGIEGIGGGGAHNGAALARSEPAPEQPNAARMSFCRDKNHGSILSGLESSRGGSNFVGGIYDPSVENVNPFPRHTLLNPNQPLLIIPPPNKHAHFFPPLPPPLT